MSKYSEQEWLGAKKLYVEEGLSYRGISERTGINFHSLARKGSPKLENWDRAREQFNLERIKAEQRELTKRLMTNGYLKAESRARFIRVSTLVLDAIENVLEEHIDLKTPIHPDTLTKLAAALQRAQSVNFAALGIALGKFEHDHHDKPQTFQSWLEEVRKERGVPAKVYPFKVAGTRGDE